MRRIFLFAALSLAACSSSSRGTKADGEDAGTFTPDARAPQNDGDPPYQGDDDDAADASPQEDAAPDVDPQPGTGEEGNGNNTGVVDAPILPGREPNDTLRKMIDVEVLGDAHEIVVGPAYAMRDSTSSTSTETTTLVAVRSTAAKTRCGLGASSYRVLDAQRAVLADGGSGLVNGSVRTNAKFCLGPGETGYLGFTASSTPYDNVARVSIAINPGVIETHVPGARMELKGAVGAPSSFLSKVTLTFRNVGTKTATVEGFNGTAILWDETGPVALRTLTDCAYSSTITAAPGDGVTMCMDTFTAARVTRAQAWCDFGDQ